VSSPVTLDDTAYIRGVALSDDDLQFLESNHSAAMTTIGEDGLPKVARVGVALVDGKLWCSGTTERVRTRRLRHDPRCVLYVHDAGFGWLALETTVTLLEGPDVPAQSVRLFRVMQGRPSGPLSWFTGELDEPAMLRQMVEEGRLIYQFEVHKSYGLH
jgi:Pyridoxamine 5'-phosphate oxidase